jgi:hypothetical protein
MMQLLLVVLVYNPNDSHGNFLLISTPASRVCEMITFLLVLVFSEDATLSFLQEGMLEAQHCY